MNKQPINDYFIMLGKVFEWICFESDDEVELSAVYKDSTGKYQFKGFDKRLNNSELCIATIMSSCKAYDKKYGTDFYDKFMFAKDNGVDKSEVADEN